MENMGENGVLQMQVEGNGSGYLGKALEGGMVEPVNLELSGVDMGQDRVVVKDIRVEADGSSYVGVDSQGILFMLCPCLCQVQALSQKDRAFC